MNSPCDIRALADLLGAHPNEHEDFDDEQKVNTKPKTKDSVKRKIVKEEKKKGPETVEEYFDSNQEDFGDWKKKPQWNLTYKQRVTPEDMFLQMSGKSQLTASCEDMIIEIELPGEQGKSIDVKITENDLKLNSSLYRLHIPLPHPVNPQNNNEAKWNPEEEKLKLILRMEREFDFVNF